MRDFHQPNRAQMVSLAPPTESLLLGAIAVLIVQTFRAGHHRSFVWVVVEAACYTTIPVVVLGLLLWRVGRDKAAATTLTKYILQLGALAYASLPIVSQLVTRPRGIGDATEMVVLLMIQHAAWFLTVLASLWNFRRAGFLLSSSVVMFVCLTSNDGRIYALALLFALFAMWWLMGAYWSRLESKVLDGSSETLPIRWSFLVISASMVVSVGLLALASTPVIQSVALRGFMPTSGGDFWSDDYARSGVGDGNMLTSGEDALTTGAVDANQFIEDDRPSIYDAINEMFSDAVVKKNKREHRAINISEITKHIHDVKQSEQSGKTLRVVRKPSKRRNTKRNYGDVVSNALFYVEGSVPVRLKTNTFNHFDGWDWTNQNTTWNEQFKNGFRVQQIDSASWFVVQSQNRRFLTDTRRHCLKIMRLQSATLPSPSFLDRWHIYKLHDRAMFSWSDGGIPQFDGQLPPQSVIDIVSKVPNYHVLRSSNNFTNSFTSESNGLLDWLDKKLGIVHHTRISMGSEFQTERDTGSPWVQVSDDLAKQRLRDLADGWTEGIEPGWNQVETIVHRFRELFSVDPQNVPGDDCDNAVIHFLDERAGPSYLFATTATQMLRAAGYQARLATGFLIQENDYVWQAGQSIATSENVHVWPEVCLENSHWIPLEPSPEYSIPFNTETWLQMAKRMAMAFGVWLLRHPITSLISCCLFVLLFQMRAEVMAMFSWLYWWLIFTVSAKHRLKITRQLIDARFWMAGIPRPRSALLAPWFQQVEQAAGTNFLRFWHAASYSSEPFESQSGAMAKACKDLVAALPYCKIAQFARQEKSKPNGNADVASHLDPQNPKKS